MRLISGEPRNSGGKYVLDDSAIVDSMAKAMDEEMEWVYSLMKGSSLPDAGKDDRRILFVAISRGILKYLKQNQHDFISSLELSADNFDKTYWVTDAELNIMI